MCVRDLDAIGCTVRAAPDGVEVGSPRTFVLTIILVVRTCIYSR